MGISKTTVFILLISSYSFLQLSCLDDSFDQNFVIDIGIFSGEGAWEESVTALEGAFTEMDFSFELFDVSYLLSENLLRYKSIVLPGGDPRTYSTSLGNIGRKYLRSYVEYGGYFIGFGGGAAVADADSGIWAGIGFFDGDAVWPVDRIAPHPEYTLTEIVLSKSDHELAFGGRNRYVTLYRWGPEFHIRNHFGVEIVYSYELTGTAALITGTFGSGVVVLCGCNIEFEENSMRDGTDFGSELQDPESEWDLLERIVEYGLGEY